MFAGAHSVDGGHVTRSRASTGVTIRKSYSRENLQDSDETDDDVDTHDTQEEDDLSEDMDDSTGGGLSDKAARGQSDGKKRVSKLEQLMALCEEKVEKLTGILATNGLEYEVRRADWLTERLFISFRLSDSSDLPFAIVLIFLEIEEYSDCRDPSSC